MGFLKNLRSKSKSRSKDSRDNIRHDYSSYPVQYARNVTAQLPETVLARIFIFVCPHTRDETYETCEDSQLGEGCMLCDLRDIANCARVSRKWYSIAQTLLYRSIRIDAVHYCELEDILTDRRRKLNKGSRGKHGLASGDVPNTRLELLVRTLRSNSGLANQVMLLKLPYMVRESAKGDLARAIALVPNLRYVDLPEGFYSGESACLAIRQELQGRCPQIRKMAYRAGSEQSLEWLANRHWQALEVLDLSGLALEPATLRIVLASLPSLQELSLLEMDWIDDNLFRSSHDQLPEFPAVRLLKLENLPHLTADGLSSYLEQPQNRELLSSLTLHHTGVAMADLHKLLWMASGLTHISILSTVHKSMTLSSQQIPPLSSISVQTVHFEILNGEGAHGLQKPAESYYAYLAASIHRNTLPALTTLYVRDQAFPDLLLMPPIGGLALSEGPSLRKKTDSLSFSSPPRSTNPNTAGFKQTLEIYTKGPDELDWAFTSVAPPAPLPGTHSSTRNTRPVSSHSTSGKLGPQWAQGGFGSDARRSVIMGNGHGGFLAVPQDPPRAVTPESPGKRNGYSPLTSPDRTSPETDYFRPPPSLAKMNERRHSRHDIWR